jgi:hypothetical protein
LTLSDRGHRTRCGRCVAGFDKCTIELEDRDINQHTYTSAQDKRQSPGAQRLGDAFSCLTPEAPPEATEVPRPDAYVSYGPPKFVCSMLRSGPQLVKKRVRYYVSAEWVWLKGYGRAWWNRGIFVLVDPAHESLHGR